MALKMRGGMKVYAGEPAAARHYEEAGRGRADDYYLTEGGGIARRYTVDGERVQELAALAGDAYETWVGGLDPDTGELRGRLRTDDRAVRFVEVVVNGPKSWSLAAALLPYKSAVQTSQPPTTPRRTAPQSRSSAGWPSTPPPAWARGAGRCRCRWSAWMR
jgi:hypothetical protein